ncbi:MAG: argininosuccinate lyase [Lentisphaeria bacterium]|nr:argininosuccinate lyase [Lentisphaeria bacterium]
MGSALWSGRFAVSAAESVKNFTESISYDRRLYKHDIQGSKAHAKMLASAGIIPEASARAICEELDKICKRIEKGDFTFTSDLEDIHMHIETELIKALGDEGARVHTARSRNDQVCLDIRLYLREEIVNICDRIRDLQKALIEQADANKRAILPGFTHLQHAQPVLFAHHFLAYVEMLERDIGRLMDARKRLNVLPLGSGAIAGTTLPIDREFVRKELDFPAMSRNSMDAVASRDFTCEVLAALSIFSMNISRLSEDLILWMSQEFSFMSFSDAYTTGSSLMPQKKNPDIAEISRGKTGRVYGSLISILTICKGLPLTYNRDLQEDKEGLFDAIDTVFGVLSVYPDMIRTMTIYPERMLQAANDPGLMATDLAEELVREGVPFRHAHHKVGALVRYAQENNKALNEITLEEMRSVFPEATEAMTALFKPEMAVEKRDVFGATGYKQVEKQLAFWKEHFRETAEN